MSSYIQVYLTWGCLPPSHLLTFRTWNSELWCWNNNKYRPVIYNHLCNGERGISLHR